MNKATKEAVIDEASSIATKFLYELSEGSKRITHNAPPRGSGSVTINFDGEFNIDVPTIQELSKIVDYDIAKQNELFSQDDGFPTRLANTIVRQTLQDMVNGTSSIGITLSRMPNESTIESISNDVLVAVDLNFDLNRIKKR